MMRYLKKGGSRKCDSEFLESLGTELKRNLHWELFFSPSKEGTQFSVLPLKSPRVLADTATFLHQSNYFNVRISKYCLYLIFFSFVSTHPTLYN